MSETQNKPHKPENLPLKNIDWSAIIDLVGKANRFIARYDGLLHSIINPDVLLSPLRTKEAVLSSKIEGTQATLEEVMEYEAEKGGHEAKKSDIEEVINYQIALLKAREALEEKPLTLNVIRSIHETLMRNVRGESKDPGNFRRVQNWIGPAGSNMETARFIPPTVPDMMEGLYNWEKYIHEEDKDSLVQLAIIHAQFEILHPFLDGNGRIGRVLIPLFLYYKDIIRQPVFYMSDYLESNRQDYYDALKDITDSGSWTAWIRFFLNGIVEQAERNISQTRKMIELYENMKQQIVEETHSQFAINCLDFIFSNPIFNSGEFYKESNIPRASAARMLKSLEKSEILDCLEKGSGRRPSFYVFKKLLNIINN
jgi:Fic family protein